MPTMLKLDVQWKLGGKVMTCIETQRLIMPFINKELDIDHLEEFVNHINSCPDCLEELEVYFVLLAGMKQLDEDKELSNNYHQDLMNRLKQSEELIFRDKMSHIRKKIILIIMITLVAIISSFRLGEFVVEDILQNEVTESNYLMDNLFFVDNKFEQDNPTLLDREDAFSSMIVENLADIYVYLKKTDVEDAKKMQEHFGDQITGILSEENTHGEKNSIN